MYIVAIRKANKTGAYLCQFDNKSIALRFIKSLPKGIEWAYDEDLHA